MMSIINMPMGQRIRPASPTCTSIGMQLWCTRIAICPTCIISIGIDLSFDAAGTGGVESGKAAYLPFVSE